MGALDGRIAVITGPGRGARPAVRERGDVHVLVNNAGVLRDRMLINMSDDECDAIMRVHLRGHFMPTCPAARHWRARSQEGQQAKPTLINTSSTSGLFGNVRQGNYGAAKSRLASFTQICQMELYGTGCAAMR